MSEVIAVIVGGDTMYHTKTHCPHIKRTGSTLTVWSERKAQLAGMSKCGACWRRAPEGYVPPGRNRCP